LVLGLWFSGIGVICALAYLVSKLSRYFERQADKVAIDVVNNPQGFVDAMTLIEKDYRDRLDKYTQEYHMTLDKIAECQQVAPYWGKSLKESVDWYYNQLSGAFKKVLEGNGGDHPTPRARIEYGKEAVEVKRKNQELQTTCSA
jgi:Zn-dependent protease with chaperone function